MSFQHWQMSLDAGDVVALTVDTQCDVFLVDDSNFSSFRRGGSFDYFGGAQKLRGVRLKVPRTGHWNLVLVPYPGSRVSFSNPQVF